MSVSRLVTDGCVPGSLGAHSKGRGARVVQGRPGGGGSGSGVKWAGVSLLRVGGGCGPAQPRGAPLPSPLLLPNCTLLGWACPFLTICSCPPAVWNSYWITVQTPPCGTGRATQLCTMQPPMAIDRTSNWYVWDLVWGTGAGPSTQSASVSGFSGHGVVESIVVSRSRDFGDCCGWSRG